MAMPDERHFGDLKQITFGADNAEAYWSFAGDRLIMQTNHEPYKCDQIEEMPATGGPGKLVSTGKGRTTCSYFLKGDQEIIYASTHETSPECPTPPDMSKGYYWGLFDYDIYRANADGSNLRKLTDAPGYDAEATVCPVDGSHHLHVDALRRSRAVADGRRRQATCASSRTRPATTAARSSRRTARRSCGARRGRRARSSTKYKELLAQNLVKPTKMDLWVANADGTEARQVTYLPGASFGAVLLSERQAHHLRVELPRSRRGPRVRPVRDRHRRHAPRAHHVRRRLRRLPDVLARRQDAVVLVEPPRRRQATPTGEVYRVTGGPAGEHDTNVFVADWVDNPPGATKYQPETAARRSRTRAIVTYLADDAREGRGIGTKGLARRAGLRRRSSSRAVGRRARARRRRGASRSRSRPRSSAARRPRSRSTARPVAARRLRADAVLRRSTAATGDDRRGRLGHRRRRHQARRLQGQERQGQDRARPSLRAGRSESAIASAARGSAICATRRSPRAEGRDRPDRRRRRRSEAGRSRRCRRSCPAASARPTVRRAMRASRSSSSRARRPRSQGRDRRPKLAVALEPVRTQTDNVIGVIHAGAATEAAGRRRRRRAPRSPRHGRRLERARSEGPRRPQRRRRQRVGRRRRCSRSRAAARGEARPSSSATSTSSRSPARRGRPRLGLTTSSTCRIRRTVVAMINMDMVGRMRDNQLSVNGGDSAKEWNELVEPACAAARVECTIGGSGYGPSDHMSFYIAGVPVLFFFTGSHLDYHTATDDADKINAAGGARVAMIAADVAIARRESRGAADLRQGAARADGRRRAPRGASLGTVPSYDEDPNQPPGLVLSDVVPDGPAAKAGLKGGDRIIKIGAVEIRGVDDLMFVLQAAKPGTPTKITFVRDGKSRRSTRRSACRAASASGRGRQSFGRSPRSAIRPDPIRSDRPIRQRTTARWATGWLAALPSISTINLRDGAESRRLAIGRDLAGRVRKEVSARRDRGEVGRDLVQRRRGRAVPRVGQHHGCSLSQRRRSLHGGRSSPRGRPCGVSRRPRASRRTSRARANTRRWSPTLTPTAGVAGAASLPPSCRRRRAIRPRGAFAP